MNRFLEVRQLSHSHAFILLPSGDQKQGDLPPEPALSDCLPTTVSIK